MSERITALLWKPLVSRQAAPGLVGEPDEWISLCHGRETEFSCYTGVELPKKSASVPEGMDAAEVLPHEYAVATVRGTQEAVNEVYTELPM